jgi:3D (Asp-Asp-Asp) domain-containing protein
MGRVRLKGLFAVGGVALGLGSVFPTTGAVAAPAPPAASQTAVPAAAVLPYPAAVQLLPGPASANPGPRPLGSVREQRAQPLAAVVTPRPAATPTAPDGSAAKQVINGTATSYCLTGTTATGTQAGPGAIAVDPTVIPLGSHLYVTGYGYGYAVDTGSAIKGTLIDVWYPCAQAIQWGRRPVTIYILAA